MHWAAKYIGIRYVDGGRDAAGVDCWGLLRLVYENEFHITLPVLSGYSAAFAVAKHTEVTQMIDEEWRAVDAPFEGCAVAMSQNKAIHHVGIWVPGKRVLHAWRTQCVIADTRQGLVLKGIHVVKYYQHKLWNS